MFGQRLKQLRLARGMSLEALAAEMDGIVTKQALSKYEQEKARPSPVVLNKLAAALGTKAAYLWTEPGIRVKFIAYRKGARLRKRQQEVVESLAAQSLEERVRLQDLIRNVGVSVVQVQSLPIETAQNAEDAAESLRSEWNLGLDPIASVTDVLEDHLIHVLEIDADETFDGSAAVAYRADEEDVISAAIITRRGVPGERQRLNLTHELGHLILKIPEDIDEEKVAFRFGAAFLAPREKVYGAVGTRRALIQLDELLVLKRRFGMSVQALLYRLRDLEIITETYYQRWCRDINRLGWRKAEPFEMPPERPQWLHQSTLRALAEGVLTSEQASRLLGKAVVMQEPLSLIERRAFMRLPLQERRRILAEQAERMAVYYEQQQDSVLKELQVGDFIDY